MEKFDVIIVGAGASGTMCALSVKNNKKIALVDSATFPAKKLLVTGNGRCNITNTNISSLRYNQDVSGYMAKFSSADTLSFFENIGLLFNYEEEGRVYPYSNSARSVTDVIYNTLKSKNIYPFTEQTVESIKQINNSFCVKTQDYELYADKLVIATGGNTAQNVCKNFDIKTKPFVPSLCALKTNPTKRLSGIRLSNVSVSASCNGQTKTQKGEVLFKDSGLSGIVVFNLSTLFARNNNFSGKITIDIMPEITKESLFFLIKQRLSINCAVKDLFVGVFHNEIAKEIIWRSKINPEKNTNMLFDEEIKLLCDIIKNFDFDVKGYYENNQVYSGGVLLEELTQNLEAKNQPNLYFCGEVCDVDGECGGYNLQWAWTSGHIVGENL